MEKIHRIGNRRRPNSMLFHLINKAFKNLRGKWFNDINYVSGLLNCIVGIGIHQKEYGSSYVKEACR